MLLELAMQQIGMGLLLGKVMDKVFDG